MHISTWRFLGLQVYGLPNLGCSNSLDSFRPIMYPISLLLTKSLKTPQLTHPWHYRNSKPTPAITFEPAKSKLVQVVRSTILTLLIKCSPFNVLQTAYLHNSPKCTAITVNGIHHTKSAGSAIGQSNFANLASSGRSSTAPLRHPAPSQHDDSRKESVVLKATVARHM